MELQELLGYITYNLIIRWSADICFCLQQNTRQSAGWTYRQTSYNKSSFLCNKTYKFAESFLLATQQIGPLEHYYLSTCHFVQVNKQMLRCVICMDVWFLSDCSAFPLPSRQQQCHGIVTCIKCQNQPFKHNVYNTVLCRIRNTSHISLPERKLNLGNQSFMSVNTQLFEFILFTLRNYFMCIWKAWSFLNTGRAYGVILSCSDI
jgi:hypothetical protein